MEKIDLSCLNQDVAEKVVDYILFDSKIIGYSAYLKNLFSQADYIFGKEILKNISLEKFNCLFLDLFFETKCCHKNLTNQLPSFKNLEDNFADILIHYMKLEEKTKTPETRYLFKNVISVLLFVKELCVNESNFDKIVDYIKEQVYSSNISLTELNEYVKFLKNDQFEQLDNDSKNKINNIFVDWIKQTQLIDVKYIDEKRANVILEILSFIKNDTLNQYFFEHYLMNYSRYLIPMISKIKITTSMIDYLQDFIDDIFVSKDIKHNCLTLKQLNFIIYIVDRFSGTVEINNETYLIISEFVDFLNYGDYRDNFYNVNIVDIKKRKENLLNKIDSFKNHMDMIKQFVDVKEIVYIEKYFQNKTSINLFTFFCSLGYEMYYLKDIAIVFEISDEDFVKTISLFKDNREDYKNYLNDIDKNKLDNQAQIDKENKNEKLRIANLYEKAKNKEVKLSEKDVHDIVQQIVVDYRLNK